MPQEMTVEEINSFLNSEWIGVLSVKHEEGVYAVPLPYIYDDRTSTFVLMSGGKAMTLVENMAEVCFTVFKADKDKTSEWCSVIAQGKIEKVTRREELIYLLDLIEDVFCQIMERKAENTDEVFRVYRSGILASPEASNILKLKIGNISGRFF